MDADKVREFYAVAVYAEDQAYGGPEEGGWWYTYGELEYIEEYFTREDVAYAVARNLNEAFKREAGSLYYSHPGLVAHVVTVPRYELKEEYAAQACHSYSSSELYDENLRPKAEYAEWRTDVPLYFPEHGQHYC